MPLQNFIDKRKHRAAERQAVELWTKAESIRQSIIPGRHIAHRELMRQADKLIKEAKRIEDTMRLRRLDEWYQQFPYPDRVRRQEHKGEIEIQGTGA